MECHSALSEVAVGSIRVMAGGGGAAAAPDSTLPAPSSGMWRSHDAEARRFSSGESSRPQPVGGREQEGVCLAPR